MLSPPVSTEPTTLSIYPNPHPKKALNAFFITLMHPSEVRVRPSLGLGLCQQHDATLSFRLPLLIACLRALHTLVRALHPQVRARPAPSACSRCHHSAARFRIYHSFPLPETSKELHH
mmetsp:Transcript_6715/g.9327  ORF Transcript_6715/g.9327 Transcript_6715/m.9327 type:complete len:118 (-) Transcript_6715:255-608(-)